MEIRSRESHLAMHVSERVPEALPTPGDTRFVLEFAVDGLSGSGSTWVDQDQLTSFAKQLRDLHSECRGSASINSMSPGEFSLIISATDSRGHMALKGRMSRKGQTAEFSFMLDQTDLDGFVRGFSQLAQPMISSDRQTASSESGL